MKEVKSVQQLIGKIRELEERLEESEQLIQAIKEGEVDAFAIKNENESEVFTLQSVDYAYRVLIEGFGEGAINATEEGLIVYTNPYFCELLKLPYEKVIGATFIDFVHPDSKREFKSLFKKALRDKSKGEIKLIAGEGEIAVYVSLTSLQPKLATVGIIITDLTEKKKNEKIILEYQKDLEIKNVELVQSNTELDSFAYIASHDLQEPLRKIQTFATRILEKEYENLSDSGRDHFSRMQLAALRMQNLIEDLLAYSRTNSVEREFENIDLEKIVAEVKVDLKEELKQKKAVIETNGMCKIRVIPFQFRQLLHNLIGNSLKFSRTGHPPHIRISGEIIKGAKLKIERSLRKEEYCHISVSDNGIGFEQQYGEKIFELFQRLHSKAAYDGTGIGLAIVKKIVDNHKGIITTTAKKNKGATFDIYIPST